MSITKHVRMGLVALTATLLAPAAYAGWFSTHPGYNRAIEDLRNARNLLFHASPQNVQWDQNVAIREIDACINDLKVAAEKDGKNPNAPALTVDGVLDFKGRLGKALDLLRNAKKVMDKEEDNPADRGFQARATGHVNQAIQFVEKAMHDKAYDRY
jgi:hypothetical protein